MVMMEIVMAGQRHGGGRHHQSRHSGQHRAGGSRSGGCGSGCGRRGRLVVGGCRRRGGIGPRLVERVPAEEQVFGGEGIRRELLAGSRRCSRSSGGR